MAVPYAARMSEAKPSFIRESLKLAADPSIISFAGGNPDAEYFPADSLLEACTEALRADWRNALQYSITEGNIPLRQSLQQMMAQIGIPCSLEQLVITSGSQQGLDMTGKIFLDRGDIVLVESPTYMGAINAFKFYQPRFVEVAMDEAGMDMEDLERKLQEHPGAKFIYTIPDFQNPTGRVLAAERRQRMVELAERYNVMIIEDNPYYYLRFEGQKIPPIKHFDRYGRVIYLGSISKVLCPGLRVGWVIGPDEIVQKYVFLKQAADLHTNELSQRIVAEYMRHDDLAAHITFMNREYKQKKDLMLEIIDSQFPASISCTRPEGGLFIWATLPAAYDSGALFQQAMATERVIFVPGDTFYPYGGHRNTLRLSYATCSMENIRSGMERLARFFRRAIV